MRKILTFIVAVMILVTTKEIKAQIRLTDPDYTVDIDDVSLGSAKYVMVGIMDDMMDVIKIRGNGTLCGPDEKQIFKIKLKYSTSTGMYPTRVVGSEEADDVTNIVYPKMFLKGQGLGNTGGVGLYDLVIEFDPSSGMMWNYTDIYDSGKRLTSPQKTGQHKNREIWVSNNKKRIIWYNEKVKIYGTSDCLCDKAIRNRNPGR